MSCTWNRNCPIDEKIVAGKGHTVGVHRKACREVEMAGVISMYSKHLYSILGRFPIPGVCYNRNGH